MKTVYCERTHLATNGAPRCYRKSTAWCDYKCCRLRKMRWESNRQIADSEVRSPKCHASSNATPYHRPRPLSSRWPSNAVWRWTAVTRRGDGDLPRSCNVKRALLLHCAKTVSPYGRRKETFRVVRAVSEHGRRENVVVIVRRARSVRVFRGIRDVFTRDFSRRRK